MQIHSAGKATVKLYHQKEARAVLPQNREFIAWDGEGVNIWGPGNPQSYVLFGNSADGCITSDTGLTTFMCLDFIIESGTRHPDAIHVGFAFGYDSNMIVQSLSPTTLLRLHKQGFVRLKRKDGTEYVVTYRKSKYFQVTRTLPGKAKTDWRTKVTVRIYDIFTFFMSSFVQAYEDMIGKSSTVVTAGKAKRGSFTIEEMEMIKQYWTVEIEQLRELAEELRKRLYGAELFITEWHGPGALASYSMKQRGIKNHMVQLPDDLRLAGRYAYAAGRFELYKTGRHDRPVYGIDRNSAYPYALTQLPSLTEGQWVHSSGERVWTQIQSFGIYHLKLALGGLLETRPSPLFLRDKHHELFYPWHVEGWYWGPEAEIAVRLGAKVLESWEYHGWETKPFAYIGDMYQQRKEWKKAGNSAQLGLKLCMNAITGKAAQRVGYDPRTGRIPAWHQLEWAGWVTSYTRAAMFQLIHTIGYDDVISVETDGVYTTRSPESLGITASDELGGWSVDSYSEVMYVQSGLAWLKKNGKECIHGCEHDKDNRRSGQCSWEQKRRGLDNESFLLDHCRDYLRTLDNSKEWPKFEGVTTRFTSMGQALATKDPASRHCVWVTDKREISTGRQGKRIHSPRVCRACKMGANAYEQAHDLIISPAFLKSGPHSYPHDVPWEESDREAETAWWRTQQEQDDLYA